VVGGYGSAVLTRDIFIEDLSSVEEPYNATLNSAAQGLAPETEDEYGQLTASFSAFQDKYARYRPLAVKFDNQFEGDMQNLSIIISGSGGNIAAGNLTRAGADLKTAEPIFTGIKERNGLS
jgi:hypothetical protein